MSAPVLCVIQARYHSTRLPGKMLLTLDDPVHGTETLIARAWRLACEAFGADNVVMAMPKSDELEPLGDEIRRIGAEMFLRDGVEADVLSRFYLCAHRYRWRPDTVIVRYTPDDPWKYPPAMRLVAEGRRMPVEAGCEAFTLAMLDRAQQNWHWHFPDDLKRREHITLALFPTEPPPAGPHPSGTWTIDTPEQLEAARAWLRSR